MTWCLGDRRWSGFAQAGFPCIGVAGALCIVPPDADDFRVTLFGGDQRLVFTRSSVRHGLEPAAIAHAIRQHRMLSLFDADQGLWLVLGPDHAGRFLEVLLRVDDGLLVVFHAMLMRRRFSVLLQHGGEAGDE